MKGKYKKTIALIMAMVMVLSINITALAEGNANLSSDENGVTINMDVPGGEGETQQAETSEVTETGDEGNETAEIEEMEEQEDETAEGEATVEEVDGGVNADVSINETGTEDIIVNDEKKEEAVSLTSEVNGVTVSITAEAGVLPAGTILNVVQISEEETQGYLDELSENEGVELGEALAFDITILDEEGNEIQPDGEVSVSFSDIEFADEEDEILVYHVIPEEEQAKNEEKSYGKSVYKESKRQFRPKTAELFKNNDSKDNKGSVRFKTDHFSIYIVGTNTTSTSSSRYQMVRGETIELEERDKTHNGVWSISEGSSVVEIVTSTNSSGNIKATIKAKGTGDATVRYRLDGSSNNNKNSYFYIKADYPRYEMNVGDTIDLEETILAPAGTWSVSSGSNNATIESSSNATNNIKATVEATAEGSATVRYRIDSSKYTYFYLTIKNPYKDSYDILVPAEEPVVNPNELPPGTVAAHKSAKWVNYGERIAEITLTVEGMPIISGSDVILILDKSGSMGLPPYPGAPGYYNALPTAKLASNKFIEKLFEENNKYNNRVAFIPFSGSSGGTSSIEVNNVTKGSVNFSYDEDRLKGHVNATVANGGTNYSAALQKAIQYASSRLGMEKDRPLYIVFMSDGEPSYNNTNWNGTNQAETLKGLEHNATIYSVGILLNAAGTSAIKAIASTDTNGQPLYTPVSNVQTDLEPVLQTIAGKIKKAGTEASFKDYISEYFEYYNAAPYISDGTYNDISEDPIVEIKEEDLGDILKDTKTFKIFVKLKDEYNNVEQEFPTNVGIELNYKDVDGILKQKTNPEIEEPEVSVGFGTIDIKYVLVDGNGNYINLDGTSVEPGFKEVVGFEDYLYNESEKLEVQQTYNVNANPPSGYNLYGGETATKEIDITWANMNQEVEFKVVACPKYTVTFDENGGDTEANPKIQIVNKGASVGTLPTPPTRIGYSFNGWNTQSDGEGTEFVATTPVNANITVYAQWKRNIGPSITVTGYKGIYDGAGHSITVTGYDVEAEDTVWYKFGEGDWSETKPTFTNVSETTVQVKVTNPNYEDRFGEATVEITPKEITVTADDKSKVYGDVDPAYTASVEPVIAGLTYSISRASGDNVGTYAITVSGDEIQGNYKVTYKPGTLTITAKEITVTADDKSKVYGDVDPAYTASVEPVIAGLTYSISRASGDNVGTYAITVSGDEIQGNYKVTYKPGTLTITAKEITVTADDKSKVYGDVDPAYTASVEPVIAGLTYSISRASGDNVGTYAITVSGDEIQGNYKVTYKPGTLTITAKEITVTADDKSKVYGDVDPAYTASVEPVIAGLTYSISRASGDNVGTYAITVSGDEIQGNYKVTYKPGTLTITAKEITVTADDKSKVYGDVDPAYTASVEPVIAGLTYSISRASGDNVGTYAITVSGDEIQGNYKVTYKPGTLTITAKEITVTADDKSKVYGDVDPAYTASVEPVIAGLTYSISRASGDNVGTYAITVSGDEIQGNYKVTYKPGTLTITAKEITVTADDKSKVYGDVDPAYTASVEPVIAGLTYSISRASGDNVGTYAITVSGDEIQGNYKVTYKPGTLTITAKEITVTADDKSKVYGDVDPAYTASVEPVIAGLTYSISRASGDNVGTYAITVSGDEIQGNYKVTYKPGTLTITAKEITVTADDKSKVYGDVDPAYTASVEPVIAGLTYSISRASGDNVGTYAITVSGDEIQGNYKVTYKPGTLTITAKEITVTADDKSKVYGDVDPAYTASVEPVIAGLTYSISRASGDNVGTYAITVSGDEIQGNYKVTYKPGTLTITAKEITVTADDKSKVYGDVDPAYTASVEPVIAGLTYSISRASGDNVGTYAITVSGDEIQGNYKVTYKPGTLTITAKEITVTADDKSKVYGDVDPAYTASVEPVIAGLTYSISRASGDNVGTYAITVSGDEIQGNYKVTYKPGTLTITAKEITVTADDKSKVYGDVDPAYTASVEPVIAGLTYSISRASGDNVGTYAITVSGDEIQGNYKVTYKPGTLTITAKEITVTADDKSKVYGDVDPAYTASVEPVIAGLTYSISRASGDNVGTYAITVSGDEIQGNYKVTYKPGTLTITAKEITVTADDKSKVYGDVDPAYTASVEPVIAGLTYSISRASGDNVGTYAITVSGDEIQGNYKVTYKPGTLTITAKEITVTADDKSKVYGDVDPAYTASVEPVIAGLTYSISRASGDNVGTYAITVSGDEIQGNYKVTYKPGTLTITAKEITVTADDKSKVYGDVDPAYTASVEPVIAGLTYSISRASGDNVGTYAITVSGDEIQGNYKVTYKPGTLTITAKEITVTADDKSKVYGDVDPAYTASVEPVIAGLTYSISRASGDNVGTYAITVSGDEIQGNYKVTYKPGTLTITAKEITVTADDKSKVYGDVDPAYTASVEPVIAGLTYSISRASGDNVGTYAITVSGDEIQGNYKVTYKPGTLTITAKEITVTADDKSKVYGEDDPELTGVIAGLGEEETLEVTYIRSNDDEAAGTYEGVITATTNNPNYSLIVIPGDFTINKRPITVTAASASKTYNGTPLTNNEYSITSGSLVEGHKLSATVVGSQTAVGSSPNRITDVKIVAQVQTEEPGEMIPTAIEEGSLTEEIDVTNNYEITKINGTLTVSTGGGGGGGGTTKPKPKEEVVVVPEEEIPAELPQLNKRDHFQYIQGYPDGMVRPEGNITRDEVAAVFYRLLDPEYRDKIRTTTHKFSDVAPERWSNKHIATLAKGGIITGYLDGTFKPGNYITRSELATIASRFDNLSPFVSDKFSDIKGHWANKYINSAAEKGWVKGYVDGTFKPDQYITRAEFVTLVNNVLERRVTRSEILPGSKKFPDLPEDKWFYEAMMEAVNSHYYERLDDGYENWLEIYYPVIEM